MVQGELTQAIPPVYTEFIGKQLMKYLEVCPNCGDGSGWQFVNPYGWVACADCNDDMKKPKPLRPMIDQRRAIRNDDRSG
jgi:hypothetical protein